MSRGMNGSMIDSGITGHNGLDAETYLKVTTMYVSVNDGTNGTRE